MKRDVMRQEKLKHNIEGEMRSSRCLKCESIHLTMNMKRNENESGHCKTIHIRTVNALVNGSKETEP